MSGGVFAVSRGIFDDPDYAPEPFTQREAVMWLVASAAWKEHPVRGARGRIVLQRGEFCFSVRFLAERWQWSKSRVARFLTMLENRDTIRDAKRDGEQVWIIPKYNDFQRVSLPKRDSNEDAERDGSGTEAGHERDKEEDRIKQDNTSSLRSDVERAFKLFVETVEGTPIPTPTNLNDQRRKKLAACISRNGLDQWGAACARLVQSDLCLGRKSEWTASLDFLLQPSSFVKLMEGNYDNRTPQSTGPPGGQFQSHAAKMRDEAAAREAEANGQPH